MTVSKDISVKYVLSAGSFMVVHHHVWFSVFCSALKKSVVDYVSAKVVYKKVLSFNIENLTLLSVNRKPCAILKQLISMGRRILKYDR